MKAKSAQMCITGGPKIFTLKRIAELDHTRDINVK